MVREPVQQRSRERVERILVAASELLSEHGGDKLTARGIAERAGVRPGTIYQYFTDMAAVIASVNTRAKAVLRDTLEQRIPKPLAKDADAYFGTLIAVLDEMQHVHPELGCMVRPRPDNAFARELASELRAIVASHVADAFGSSPRRDPAMTRRLHVALVALIAVLEQAPQRQSKDRAAYLQLAARMAASTLRSD